MDSSVFFILFFSLVLSNTQAFEVDHQPLRCCHSAFTIKSPFRLKSRSPEFVGDDQSFDLFCRNNSTMIHFPSYGDLVVKSISYDARKLNLIDPKNCVHEVFLNLDLSQTPFGYYYVVKNYTYLNCSASLGPSVTEVPCLSGSKHHVYTAESPVSVPGFCRPIKTVAIPFAYSSYLSDNSFGLGLTWNQLHESEDSAFQSKSGWFHLAQKRVRKAAGTPGSYESCERCMENESFSISFIFSGGVGVLVAGMALLAAAILTSMKIFYNKIFYSQKEKKIQYTEDITQEQNLLKHQIC